MIDEDVSVAIVSIAATAAVELMQLELDDNSAVPFDVVGPAKNTLSVGKLVESFSPRAEL